METPSRLMTGEFVPSIEVCASDNHDLGGMVLETASPCRRRTTSPRLSTTATLADSSLR
jgi:hypothetical protein